MQSRRKLRIRESLLEEIIEHYGDELLDGTHYKDKDLVKMKIMFRGGFVYCLSWLKWSGFDIGIDRKPEETMGDFTRMLEAIGL